MTARRAENGMSKGINKVTLVGNLGADPETRATRTGDPVVNMRVATSENWTDKGGERQERTEWHTVTVFGKLAAVCEKYLRKGSRIYIEGSLRTERWTDNAGTERYTTKIVARDMLMLDGARGGGERGDQPQRQPAERAARPAAQPEFDDDIPF